MVIKSWNYFLFESILYTSDEFRAVLSSIKDDEVANSLLTLIDKDIRTNYNLLRTTDKNDLIGFLPDRQATTKLKSMNSVALLLNSNFNTTTIGRITKSILSDNGIVKSDREIEVFVNKFKAAYDYYKMPKDNIRVVDGEEIREWYHEDKYASRTKGTLSKSCMRYEECQDFFNIYVGNPSVCKLLIKVNDDNQLEARALIWETDSGKYLDRVYYTNDSDEDLMREWFKTNFKSDLSFRSGLKRLEIQLGKQWTLDPINTTYPYMDSFPYYYVDTNKLYNYEPKVDNRKHLFYLQETDGSYQEQDLIYCEWEGESYPSEEVVYSEFYQYYIHKYNAVYSNRLESYIQCQNSVYSNHLNDYLIGDRSVFVMSNIEGDGDYFPEDSGDEFNYAYDEISGECYDKKLLINHDGRYYLKGTIIKVGNISESDFEKWYQIYGSNKYRSSILDEDVFGFTLEDIEYVSKRTYFWDAYNNIIYKEFLDMLNSLRGKVKDESLDDKINELEEANNLLENNSHFYKYNNYIHNNYKNVDGLLSWFDEVSTYELFEELIKQLEVSSYIFRNSYNENMKDTLFKVFKNPKVYFRATRIPTEHMNIFGEQNVQTILSLSGRITNKFIDKISFGDSIDERRKADAFSYVFSNRRAFKI